MGGGWASIGKGSHLKLNDARLFVGAAEGCDLLILFLKGKSKDRSLRQLLQ
jgi:hypothetical protein